jgi:hypothetical protein
LLRLFETLVARSSLVAVEPFLPPEERYGELVAG